MKCPKCKRHELVQVNMAVNAATVVHRCCSYCDLRWWESDGERVSLAEILEMAAPPAA